MTRDREERPSPVGQPRYGRMAVAGSAVAVTVISVLGGLGTLPTSAEPGSARAPATQGLKLSGADLSGDASTAVTPTGAATPTGAVTPTAPTAGATAVPRDTETSVSEPDAHQPDETRPDETRPDETRSEESLPADSGTGRRVVFSEDRQRVWLVDAGGGVRRTYPVSGSIYDNLDPGTYAVYSRSEQAWGIEDSGSMRWFVRFTHGDNAAIGFHDIPVDEGSKVQGVDQLGTPLSHGCIRQRTEDALALWRFAPLGTTVVVTA